MVSGLTDVLTVRRKANHALQLNVNHPGTFNDFELELCREIVELSHLLESALIRESRRILMENEVKG